MQLFFEDMSRRIKFVSFLRYFDLRLTSDDPIVHSLGVLVELVETVKS